MNEPEADFVLQHMELGIFRTVAPVMAAIHEQITPQVTAAAEAQNAAGTEMQTG